jgi:hypothetical protein
MDLCSLKGTGDSAIQQPPIEERAAPEYLHNSEELVTSYEVEVVITMGSHERAAYERSALPSGVQ